MARAFRMKFPWPAPTVICLKPEGELNLDGLLPTCPSKIKASEILELRRKWDIPDSMEIMIPGPEHAFYNPPVGYMCVHEAALMCGWKLPLIQEFKDILNYIRIGPSQVIPNSLGNLICFAMICKKKGVDINFENFSQLFRVAFSHENPLFYTFITRQAYTFIEDPISSLGCKWLEHYIFVRMALRLGQSCWVF